MNEQESSADLLRLINESAGTTYQNRTYQLSFSQNVFQINALELVDAVQRVKDPDQGFSLMLEKHREASHQSHREVNRRLHNFVSSALTLVEHTRIFMRKHYKGTDLFASYEKQVKAVFDVSPVAQFVQGLRNYILHRGWPNSSMFMKFRSTPGANDGTGDLETGVHYHKSSLLEWSEWKPVARSYLESAGEEIDILVAAQEYQDLVKEFGVWLEKALLEHHKKDLQELGELQARYRALSPTLQAAPVAQPGGANLEVVEPFHLSTEQAANLDQVSSDLLGRIREITIRPHKESFATEIQTIKITEQQILGPMVGWLEEADGNLAYVFIQLDGKSYGLSKSDHDALDKLVHAVMKSAWAPSRLSREFVESTFCDWARKRFKTDGETFSGFLCEEAKKEVAAVEVWAPIAFMTIEENFQFGPVRVETVGEAAIERFRHSAPVALPEQKDQVDTLFANLRREIQGYAAIVVSVEAEPTYAEKHALQMAQDAVGLLRFFSPAAYNSFSLNPVGIKGADFIPRSKLISMSANRFGLSENPLVKNVGFWELPKKIATALKPSLDIAASLVQPTGLSEFALAVRASILTFSKGTTLAGSLDRLQTALTAVEGVFLKHDMEARSHNVARRMSLMLAKDKSGREGIRQKVQQIYWLREQPQLAAHERRLDEMIAAFTLLAHNALDLALQNSKIFPSKAEFLTAVDQFERPERQ